MVPDLADGLITRGKGWKLIGLLFLYSIITDSLLRATVNNSEEKVSHKNYTPHHSSVVFTVIVT